MLPPAEQVAFPPRVTQNAFSTICSRSSRQASGVGFFVGFALLPPVEQAVRRFYPRHKMHLQHIFFFKGIRPFYQNGRLPDDARGSFLALPKEFVAEARQCHLLAAVQRCAGMSLVRPLQVASSPGAVEKEFAKSLPGD